MPHDPHTGIAPDGEPPQGDVLRFAKHHARAVVPSVANHADVAYRRLYLRCHAYQARAQQFSFLYASVVEMPALAAVEIVAPLHDAVDIGIERRVVLYVEVLFGSADHLSLCGSRTAIGDFHAVHLYPLTTHKGEHLHPSFHHQSCPSRLYGQALTARKVQPRNVGLLRLEECPLHLKAPAQGTADGPSLYVDGHRVVQLVSTGRKEKRCLRMLAAIGSSPPQSLRVGLAVVRPRPELRNRYCSRLIRDSTSHHNKRQQTAEEE